MVPPRVAGHETRPRPRCDFELAPGDGGGQSSLAFVSRLVAFAPHSPRGSPSGSHRWQGLPQIPSCTSSLESWTPSPWSSCPRPGRWPSQKQSGSLLQMCSWRSHARNVSPCTRRKGARISHHLSFRLSPSFWSQGRKCSTRFTGLHWDSRTWMWVSWLQAYSNGLSLQRILIIYQFRTCKFP